MLQSLSHGRAAPAGAARPARSSSSAPLAPYAGLRRAGVVDAAAPGGSGPASLQAAVAARVAGARSGRRAVRVTRMMFERFTEKAIKVVMLAQEEARRLGHNFVGTEQILLGLIGESTGEAPPPRAR